MIAPERGDTVKKTETPKDAQEERRDPCDCSTEEYLRRVKADYLLKMVQEKDSPASEEKKE